ncbi:nucleoside/nucleotide kinase family protein [Planosporangium flavigriseum]|uniref:Nucleoside/nucleotide kinase family protein n=1 Tax=Planosporangium flavigriseum TaxID=373681 RepID=A0A8J3PPA9_9ACTN|nr:nucleoside/nucleotide kinase family protein [Planosporangium flavigriseum]NJC68076.1 nucleoside/nucleotide kinase family protein [Planosporangium flavigriseum]GIG76862.1 nucleoside/nucleotide kinase family protein [Planosporangium flavigriseum]
MTDDPLPARLATTPDGRPEEPAATVAELAERARRLVRPGQRRILGITGAPGAGKSTVAEALVAALDGDAVLVPMDGFHLANAELERLGRRDRKGAVDTFDAAGYAALLRRLRDPAEGCVYAPVFRREIEEPIAGAIPVHPDVPLVVTEGNYLLVDDGEWAPVRGLLDEVWFLDSPDPVRLDRLVRRHERYGKSSSAARAWAYGSDQRNAELVLGSRDRADLVVRLIG